MRAFLPILFTLLFLGCSQSEQQKNEDPGKTFNVMAPLHLKVFNNPDTLEEVDWKKFEKQLKEARQLGVDAVSVDVWWGDVEGESDNQFNWTYYDRVFSTIIEARLKIVPILSFHQCGGNSGDDYTSLLPHWIWEKLVADNPKIKSELDLKYVSDAIDSLGNHTYSEEFVALWTDDLVMYQYEEFMAAFEEHFREMIPLMQEINISCGPAGELRYPSYNSHDNWSYPSSGHMQNYSDLARYNFQQFVINKYESIDTINVAWESNFNDISEVQFPVDVESFFSTGEYYQTVFGKDLIEWYNQSLIDHGVSMVETGLKVFEPHLGDSLKLGIKVPGIHWQMRNPNSPRAAEIKCGLINADGIQGANGYFNTLSKLYQEVPQELVNLHFTCLEMGNEYPGEGPSDHYSRAQDLVFQIDSVARVLNINVKGENALSGNLYEQFGWNRLNEALEQGSYEGLTILRMGDVTTENDLGKEQYELVIKKFK